MSYYNVVCPYCRTILLRVKIKDRLDKQIKCDSCGSFVTYNAYKREATYKRVTYRKTSSGVTFGEGSNGFWKQ